MKRSRWNWFNDCVMRRWLIRMEGERLKKTQRNYCIALVDNMYDQSRQSQRKGWWN